MTDARFEDTPEHKDITERPEELSSPAEGKTLEQELSEAKAKAQEYLESWQRAQADYANFRKRLEMDKSEAIKYANTGLILRILPVLDDFKRAVAHVPPSMADDPWVEGINGIARKLETALETAGLSPIKAQGENFDPSVHEAAGCAPGKEGIVVQELQKGYMFNERVIRPSRVMVGSGESEAGVEECA
jgi:molecular chaperone GrpE